MEKPVVMCWHGFLGRTRDWQKVPWPNEWDVNTFDLWQNFKNLNPRSLEEWGARIELPAQPVWGVGYSLGGRLLMHALIAQPEKFCGAILVSAHPGLTNQDERTTRHQQDKYWQERFRNRQWADLMCEWNDQPAFRASAHWPLKENEFDRQLLAEVIGTCSLALQADLRPALAALKIPILWLAGVHDAKFTQLASDLAADLRGTLENKPLPIEFDVIENAGHRLVWDQPAQFAQRAEEFVLSSREIGQRRKNDE